MRSGINRSTLIASMRVIRVSCHNLIMTATISIHCSSVACLGILGVVVSRTSATKMVDFRTVDPTGRLNVESVSVCVPM